MPCDVCGRRDTAVVEEPTYGGLVCGGCLLDVREYEMWNNELTESYKRIRIWEGRIKTIHALIERENAKATRIAAVLDDVRAYMRDRMTQ